MDLHFKSGFKFSWRPSLLCLPWVHKSGGLREDFSLEGSGDMLTLLVVVGGWWWMLVVGGGCWWWLLVVGGGCE